MALLTSAKCMGFSTAGMGAGVGRRPGSGAQHGPEPALAAGIGDRMAGSLVAGTRRGAVLSPAAGMEAGIRSMAGGLALRNFWVAALIALIPAGAHGKSAPAAPEPAPAASAVPTLSPEARAAVDERIAKLRQQLGITAAQMPLWNAFAQAMRDNAASTEALFARRADAVARMSAVENMHSYAEIARAYADDTERLATGFDRLYASLSPTQQRAADALFRQRAVAAEKPPPRR